MALRFFRSAVVILSIALLGACSSGSKSKLHYGDSKATTTTCTGDFTSGGTITCEQPAPFVDDCQCFAQEGNHELFVECQPADGQLSVTLPQHPGTFDLIGRCGGDESFTIQKGVSVTTPSGTQAPQGGDGEINPEGSGDTAPAGEVTRVCVDNRDCATGQVCSDGNCVGSGASEPEATPPPAATPVDFSVNLNDSATVSGHYGLAHMHYQILGGGTLRAKYIYFPTSAADCTHGGLVTDQNGSPLHLDTEVYETYHAYDSGTACTGEENCRHFDLLSDPSRSLPTFCRVELPATSGDFYVKLMWPGKYSLVAQGEDGSWQQRTKEFEIESSVIESINVAVNEREPKIDIVAQASRTPRALAITGCPATGLVNHVSPEGHAEFTGSCPFQKDATISITAAGLGDNATEQYHVHCEDPQPRLRIGGDIYAPGSRTVGHVVDCAVGTSTERWWESCNAPVDLSFDADVSRVCTVSKVLPDGTTHEEGRTTVPWVRDIQIKAYKPVSWFSDGICGTSDVHTVTTSIGSGEPLVTSRLPRNYNCSQYKAIVHDSDGRTFSSEKLNFPYKPIVAGNGPLEIRDGTGAITYTLSAPVPGTANYFFRDPSWHQAWIRDECNYDMPSSGTVGSFHAREITWTVRVRNCSALLVGDDAHRISGWDPNNYGEQTVTISTTQSVGGGDWNLTCFTSDLSVPAVVKSYHQAACQSERAVTNGDMYAAPAAD